MFTEAQAYILGWQACMAGCDGRYTLMLPSGLKAPEAQQYAWTHGFLDAMEAEDGEEPEPHCAGYW